MTEAEGLHLPTLVANCVFNDSCLGRHGVKYYNNTSAPKNVVVAEDFLKTLPLSLYISDVDVSVLVQPLYVAYLTMKITKNSKKTDNIIAY